MTEALNLPDLVRQCGWCGDEDRPELIEVWRDADGESWWRHRWCSVPVPSTWSKPVSETPNLLDGTEQFMRAAGQSIPGVPTVPAAHVIALRLKMLIEEVTEAVHAVGFFDLYDYLECAADEGDAEEAIAEFIDNSGTGIRRQFDFPEMIDAFHDICVIAHGGVLEAAGREGAIATAAEVTRSNLAKIVDGKVLRRADGKIQKPDGWTPPDIAGALKAAGWVES